jgi:hypothetical protein
MKRLLFNEDLPFTTNITATATTTTNKKENDRTTTTTIMITIKQIIFRKCEKII